MTNQKYMQVYNFINFKVKPILEQHGGDIAFLGIEDNIIYVKLVGTCAHCPSSALTLYDGVEKMIKKELSQDYEIEQIF